MEVRGGSHEVDHPWVRGGERDGGGSLFHFLSYECLQLSLTRIYLALSHWHLKYT